MNADHLAAADAPDTIFFAIDLIYDRFAAMDDGFSWPELAARYLPLATNGMFMLLKKSPAPRHYRFTPVASFDADWNENIPVPAVNSGRIWAKVKMRPNFLYNRA